MECCQTFLEAASRRQPWDGRSLHQTNFRRSLRYLQIVGIGVSSSAGFGVYVMSAYVTKNEAGPSSVLSVMIAGLTALLAGLCEAELVARLPRASTSYTFSYVTLGELTAWTIGWSMLIEHLLTAAAAAKSMTHYLHYMVNDTSALEYMSDSANRSWTTSGTDKATWKTANVFVYALDIQGCVVVLLASIFCLLPVKAYSSLTTALTVMSGLILVAFTSVGYFHVKSHNWTKPPGFFAYGLGGTLSASSMLMSAFAGVDVAVSTAEEAQASLNHLPSALPLSTAIIFLAIFLATSAITLACPWQRFISFAPIAVAFESTQIFAAKYVIGFGALFGLWSCVVGRLYYPPRLLHAMSADGLLPTCLHRVSFADLPVVPTVLCGVLTSFIAVMIRFEALIEMSSIATALHFLLTATILIYVRYHPEHIGLRKEYSNLDMSDNTEAYRRLSPKLELLENGDMNVHYHKRSDDNFKESCFKDPDTIARSHYYRTEANSLDSIANRTLPCRNYSSVHHVVRSRSSLSRLLPVSAYDKLLPDMLTWRSARLHLVTYLVSCTVLVVTTATKSLTSESGWWWWCSTSVISLCLIIMLSCGVSLARLPQNDAMSYFKVSYVPLLPLLSVLLTCVLLSAMPVLAWLRLSAWSALGLALYLFYGVKHSVHRPRDLEDVTLSEVDADAT